MNKFLQLVFLILISNRFSDQNTLFLVITWQLNDSVTKRRSNMHGRQRSVPMKFPSFHGSSIRMNGSNDRIYSVSEGIDRNLPQPTTVYGRRFITSGSYHFLTGFLPDAASFLPNTARFLAVFTGNAWEYCCQETLTWEAQLFGEQKTAHAEEYAT